MQTIFPWLSTLIDFIPTDYILDDLQHSISRPGSSLGQPINNFSSQREVQYLQPVNTTMELRERSLSPSSVSYSVRQFNVIIFQYQNILIARSQIESTKQQSTNTHRRRRGRTTTTSPIVMEISMRSTSLIRFWMILKRNALLRLTEVSLKNCLEWLIITPSRQQLATQTNKFRCQFHAFHSVCNAASAHESWPAIFKLHRRRRHAPLCLIFFQFLMMTGLLTAGRGAWNQRKM